MACFVGTDPTFSWRVWEKKNRRSANRGTKKPNRDSHWLPPERNSSRCRYNNMLGL